MTLSEFTEYVIQTWKNKPDTSSPLSAARLNHMEAGIKAGSNAIKELVEVAKELIEKSDEEGAVFSTVSSFGAVGDGATDDTEALQAALDSGISVLILENGKTYLITSELQLRSNTYIYGNGATIKASEDIAVYTNIMMARNYGTDSDVGGYEQNTNIGIYDLKFDFSGVVDFGGIGIGHGSNIVIQNCEFYDFVSWHPIEINSCNGVLIDNCYFHDGPKAGANFAEVIQIDGAYGAGTFKLTPYDEITSKNIKITNCLFDLDSSLHDTNQYHPSCIGSHWTKDEVFHENIIVANNICNGAHTFVHACNWKNARIVNNVCTDIRCAVYSWMWDELEICDNNFIFSDDDMASNNYDRGIYTNANNATFGDNGSTLIHGSVTVKNNRLQNCASHAVCLSGTKCVADGNNIIDCKNNGIYVSYDAEESFITNNVVTGSAGSADIFVNPRAGTTPKSYVANNICDTLQANNIASSTEKSIIHNNIIRTKKTVNSAFTDSNNVVLS